MAIRVEGLNDIVRRLQDLGADVDDLKDVMARISTEGAHVLQGYVPVKSGKLRASARGNRAKGKAVVTVGRSTVPYAAPINYGWPARGIEAADFTGKTDQAMEPRAVLLLEQGIEELIRKRNLG